MRKSGKCVKMRCNSTHIARVDVGDLAFPHQLHRRLQLCLEHLNHSRHTYLSPDIRKDRTPAQSYSPCTECQKCDYMVSPPYSSICVYLHPLKHLWSIPTDIKENFNRSGCTIKSTSAVVGHVDSREASSRQVSASAAVLMPLGTMGRDVRLRISEREAKSKVAEWPALYRVFSIPTTWKQPNKHTQTLRRCIATSAFYNFVCSGSVHCLSLFIMTHLMPSIPVLSTVKTMAL